MRILGKNLPAPLVAIIGAGVVIAGLFRTELPAYLAGLFRSAGAGAQATVILVLLSLLILGAIFAWERHKALDRIADELEMERVDLERSAVAHRESKAALQADIARLEKENAGLKAQLAELASLDHHVWSRPLGAGVPPFIPIGERPGGVNTRKTRFISVLNLKGGVGKTTVSCYLAAAFAQLLKRGAPHKVLLVDLDFQGTLSNVCVAVDDLIRERERGATSSRLLDAEVVANPEQLHELILPMAGDLHGTVGVIPSRDDLELRNLRTQIQYVINPKEDVRLRFRRVFHTPEFFALNGGYNYVIFDCPPRLTTVAVNALAASDFVLIPTKLDNASVEAIPRTIGWLEELGAVSHAHVLGVVANEVRMWGSQPQQSHQRDLAALADRQPLPVLAQVPLWKDIWQSESPGGWATNRERLDVFLELSKELKHRM